LDGAKGTGIDSVDWAAAFQQRTPFDRSKIQLVKNDPNHATELSVSLIFPPAGKTHAFFEEAAAAGLEAEILRPKCDTYISRDGGKWCEINFDTVADAEKGWKLISKRINTLAANGIVTQFDPSVDADLGQMADLIDAATQQAGANFMNQLQNVRERIYALAQKAGPEFQSVLGASGAGGFPLGVLTQKP
jgi:hypothetical protein